MHGIKIPLQDFPLKMQEGLMREGGRICGTLRYCYRSALPITHGGSLQTVSAKVDNRRSNVWI